MAAHAEACVPSPDTAARSGAAEEQKSEKPHLEKSDTKRFNAGAVGHAARRQLETEQACQQDNHPYTEKRSAPRLATEMRSGSAGTGGTLRQHLRNPLARSLIERGWLVQRVGLGEGEFLLFLCKSLEEGENTL